MCLDKFLGKALKCFWSSVFAVKYFKLLCFKEHCWKLPSNINNCSQQTYTFINTSTYTWQAPTNMPAAAAQSPLSTLTPVLSLATKHTYSMSSQFSTSRFILLCCWKQTIPQGLHPVNKKGSIAMLKNNPVGPPSISSGKFENVPPA